MKTIELPIEKIEANPANYRKLYQGIEQLADSIAHYGLLQNLIIWEYEPGKYHVKCGERRRRAILILKERHHPVAKEPVRCVLLSHFSSEDVVENEVRRQPASWELGARLHQMYEVEGLTQAQIGTRIGCTQSHVSMCIRFHKGIHPRVQAILSSQGPECIAFNQLERLACVVDELGDPIEEKQFNLMLEFLDVKTKRRNKRPPGDIKREREMLLTRARHLVDGTARVPKHARDTYDKIVAYLRGERKRLQL